MPSPEGNQLVVQRKREDRVSKADTWTPASVPSTGHPMPCVPPGVKASKSTVCAAAGRSTMQWCTVPRLPSRNNYCRAEREIWAISLTLAVNQETESVVVGSLPLTVSASRLSVCLLYCAPLCAFACALGALWTSRSEGEQKRGRQDFRRCQNKMQGRQQRTSNRKRPVVPEQTKTFLAPATADRRRWCPRDAGRSKVVRGDLVHKHAAGSSTLAGGRVREVPPHLSPRISA
ncbi:hypothetical protein V8E36_005469 [Tilletia maclaganii]